MGLYKQKNIVVIYEQDNQTIRFEDEVNDKIKEIKPQNVIDIKFAVTSEGFNRAMIIYYGKEI